LIYLVDQEQLLMIFDVSSFDLLEDAIFNTPPSMSEYYLNDAIMNLDNTSYLNKNNIQQTIQLDSYNIFIDYDCNTYIEKLHSDVVDEYTESLW